MRYIKRQEGGGLAGVSFGQERGKEREGRKNGLEE